MGILQCEHIPKPQGPQPLRVRYRLVERYVPSQGPSATQPTTLQRHEVNKPLAAYPPGVDLSTPEGAWAAWQRACGTMDAQGVVDLSWVEGITPEEMRRAWQQAQQRDPEGLRIYNQAQLASRLVEVWTYGDELAETISHLPMPEGKGRAPYSLRIFGRINGQWKNLGEDRLASVEAARQTIEQKKDRLWEYFQQIKQTVSKKPPVQAPATQPATQPAKLNAIKGDSKLLVAVVSAHRDNVQKIASWRGDAQIESIIADQKGVVLARKATAAFLYDRAQQSTRWTWNYTASDEREGDRLVSTLPLLASSSEQTCIRTPKAYYRWELTLRSPEGKFHHALVILPPEQARVAGFSEDFDPMWYFTRHGLNVEDYLMAWAREPSSSQTQVKIDREGSRVSLDLSSASGTHRFEFDLSRGGNLMAYASHWLEGSGESEWTYTQQAGVWLPETFTNTDRRKAPDGSARTTTRRVQFVASELNRPVDPVEFTVEALGIKPGTRVTDHITNRLYQW
jgi:hypothetical protein